MPSTQVEVVVAGHICLDVIPTLQHRETSFEGLFVPGKLINVGHAEMSTGGAVPNTGLALQRLGISTRLIGKIGDDLFGAKVLSLMMQHDSFSGDGMIVSNAETTSYSVVITAPKMDRIFLHHSGANDTFGASDVQMEMLEGARVFHFGYPPLMQRMYLNDGAELTQLFELVKAAGFVTSLDMALPDAESPAGRVDWVRLLKRVLPFVDVFLPSLKEILFMLDYERFVQFQQDDALGGRPEHIDGHLLSRLAEQLLNMGAGIVGLKLGDQGLYIRTTSHAKRLQSIRGKIVNFDEESWINREMLTPCFAVEVIGTTGAGDATVAGFLAGLVHGLRLEDVLTLAVAVGACSVGATDALSGIPTWDHLQERLSSSWGRRLPNLSLKEWVWAEDETVCLGPNDQKL